MLIDAQSVDETRVVVMDGDRIDVVDFENDALKQLKSNVYLARVTRVEPSLQAAFVDYGGNRHGFLPFSEIHPDYYQIPAEDREKLIAEAAEKLAQRQAERAEARRKAKEKAAAAAADEANAAANADQAEAADVEIVDDGNISVAETVSSDDETVSEAFSGNIEIVDDASEPLFNELIPAGASDHEPADETNDLSTDKAEQDTPDPALSDEADEAVADLAAIDGDMPADEATSADKSSAEAEASTAGSIDSVDSDDEDDNVDEDDELEARAILRSIIAGRYKIQDVIKRRQVMLIQVNKEERGNKGAALTSYLSLAGRYCVLMPNTQRGGGISRKIASPRDRRKLKQILSEIQIPSGISVIVRTAGSERSKAEIRRDYEYLMRTWDEIREKALTSQAPALVYEEGNVIKRAVRDLYSRDMDEIMIDGVEGYESAKSFMRTLTPSHAKKVKQHKSATPLFLEAGIEAKLDTLHDPVVPLASGGYLVMNQTEALVAVDVNSGKATKERNIEDTALQTNLEAAAEVARQLRLRDMAGLVVIDFIDMDENRHRAQVERKLREAMKGDRARIQLGRISSFGLLELSRQRLRPSVFETSMQTCPTCSGTGLVRTDISFGRAILRQVEQLAQNQASTPDSIEVTVPFNAGLLILNQLRQDVVAMETRLGCPVIITPDAHTSAPQFRIALHSNGRVQVIEEGASKRDSAGSASEGRRGRNGRRNDRRGDRDNGPKAQTAADNTESGDKENDTDGEKSPSSDAASETNKRSRKRGGRNRRKSDESNESAVATDVADSADTSEESSNTDTDVSADESDESKKKNRRRGKRGGRRRGKKEDEVVAETNGETDDATDVEAGDLVTASSTNESSETPTEVSGDAGEALSETDNAASVEPTSQSAQADAGREESEQSDTVAPVLEDTPPKEGPKRRGWFSRAKDAIKGK